MWLGVECVEYNLTTKCGSLKNVVGVQFTPTTYMITHLSQFVIHNRFMCHIVRDVEHTTYSYSEL